MDYSLARRLSVLVALLHCVGCNEPATAADAASPRDAGSDVGSSDAGTTPDAPGDDAATSPDASGPDAGDPDAGDVDADVADAAEDDAATAGPVTPGPGDVVITEIQAAPVGYADDSLAEWVEIHNPSATVTYDLQGCIFSDKPTDDDYTIPAELLVAPGGYVVLSSAVFTEATHGFVSDEVYGSTGTGLSGSGDAPTLKCGGAIVDTADYAGTGFPVPETMEGHTIQLSPTALDATANDDGANWCFSTMLFVTSLAMDNFGTPGEANEACP